MNRPITNLFLAVICLCFLSCSTLSDLLNPPSKVGKDKYYDVDNKLISKRKYYDYLYDGFYPLKATSNDTTVHTLTIRMISGMFSQSKVNEIWSLLSQCTDQIENLDFIGVVYWHGTIRSPLNSYPNGIKTKLGRKGGLYGYSEKHVNEFMTQFGQGRNISMYYNDLQLEVTSECHDEGGKFWNHFFDHHVRYSSFAIISKKGFYEAYLGEHSGEYYFDAIKRVMDKSMEFEKRKD